MPCINSEYYNKQTDATMQLTQMENSLGAVVVSPVGDIDEDMCSRLIPDMCTKPSNRITTLPLLPLKAQHSPGKTPVW